MEAGWGRIERRTVRGAERRAREKQLLILHELLRAVTVCWHDAYTRLLERRGERRGSERGEEREGRV